MADDIGSALGMFEHALEIGDHPDEATALLERVLAIQRANGGDLVTDDGELPLRATLTALAELAHDTAKWARLRTLTAELRAIAPFQGSAHTMHAIALKRLGDTEGARAALDRGLAVAPAEVGPRIELARQALARGDRPGALAAVSEAMDRGAEPGALREDPDLAGLAGDVHFEHLVSHDHHVTCLTQLLLDEHAELAAAMPADEAERDAWLEDDDTIASIDDGTDLASELLDTADIGGLDVLPPDPEGNAFVDVSTCEPVQLAVIQAVLACHLYWHALPFQLVLGEHHLPATDPADARERLGLTT